VDGGVVAAVSAWRDDPRLAGRFHPDFPDDLQVLVHDGGPRVSKNPPELIWARIVAARDTDGDYDAVALNQPYQLSSLKEGTRFVFRVRAGAPHPFLVSDEYRADRPLWQIEPCSGCGVDDLLDPPSRLASLSFRVPDGAVMAAFTQICPMCGKGQLVAQRKP
jgi:hypothetical protein